MKQEDYLVAVIGISGRFPGAGTVDEFWENLVEGKESISFFSKEELLEAGVEPKTANDPNYVPARGIVENSTFFDAAFFNYSPNEAKILDPQHRIFLECCWHALEDAGYSKEKIKEKIGVFAGTGAPLYHLELSRDSELEKKARSMAGIIGNEKDYLSNRVSFNLNLSGPSIAVQCACSSSLSAIILGMQSLHTHQSDLVLAGGVSIYFPQKQGYLYEKGSLDSPDGHCRTFDQRAEGTVFSSGAGVIVLKRYQEAVQDNDQIYCVIRSGSINNDGKTKASYTAPSILGQVALEVDVLEFSGIDPETISYVEAHGTATQMGDPIEINALTQAFRNFTDRKSFCAIGTVKTNIGHTDVASGVIGLIKTALSMKYKTLPGVLHFEKNNPQINFEETPFYVNNKTVPWKTSEGVPRRALVNSFGVGGTNACICIEEAPTRVEKPNQKNFFLIPLSANSEKALNDLKKNLVNFAKKYPHLNLADISYTLQFGRKMFKFRDCLACSNMKDFISKLEIPHRVASLASDPEDLNVIFMFPGQGNQYLEMGKALYLREPFIRNLIDEHCKFLRNELNYEVDLLEAIFNPRRKNIAKTITDTKIAQPALFILEYTLAKYLISFGIVPQVLIGHSVGEFVAAVLAGVMESKDALKLIAYRAKLVENLPKGSMLAVFLNHKELKEKLSFPLEISVVNSPQLSVVSGPQDAIDSFEFQLTKEKISFRRLDTSHAFHSHMMDPIIPKLYEAVKSIKLSAPQKKIMSTVKGEYLTENQATDPHYWAEHARNPVNFLGAIESTMSLGKQNLFIEVGPGNSLESAVKHTVKNNVPFIIRTMEPKQSSIFSDKFLYNSIGKLWSLGLNIHFESFWNDEKRFKISLPGYPFQREEYILKPSLKSLTKSSKGKDNRQSLENWFYIPNWKKLSLVNRSISDEDNKSSDLFTWICFHNNDSLSKFFSDILKEERAVMYFVERGSNYSQLGDFEYRINPNQEEDYLKLLRSIKLEQDKSLKILHLWNYGNNYVELDETKTIEKLENRAFYEPLFLEKALIKNNNCKNLSIYYVLNNMYSLFGEALNPMKSLLTGPARVFSSEYPQAHVKLIDLPYNPSFIDMKTVASLICTTNSNAYAKGTYAIRNNSIWTPYYEAKPINPSTEKKYPLRDTGVYLITGGLGAIGFQLAKYVVGQVKPTLLFVQRFKFPHRSDWRKWIEEHSSRNEVSQKIEQILELESKGASIEIYQADISSELELESIFKEINSKYKKISGVFHCAGVASGGIIALKSDKDALEVLKPKVRGTLFLHKFLSEQNLDFFIASSSVTSIIGEEGQIDYCSANAFLDAFCHSQQMKYPGIYTALNWDAWAKIGMAVEGKEINSIKKKVKSSEYINTKKEYLKLIEDQPEKRHFQLLIDSEKDWFISSHRLNKIPALVGTAFLEFLSIYSQKYYPTYTCNIQARFVSPLMFFDGSFKELFFLVDIDGQVQKFTFFSQNKEGTFRQIHFEGKLLFSQKEEETYIDVEQKKKEMVFEKDIRQPFDEDPKETLNVDDRWRLDQEVYVGKNEFLGKVSMPKIYRHEVNNFSLHPALLDFSLIFAAAYFTEGVYLPMSYEKITLLNDLDSEIYSYIKIVSTEKNELVLDINLLDLNGKLLFRCEKYKLQKIQSDRSSKTNSVSEDANDILPSEGVEAFKRLFHQYYVPQMVISPKNFLDKVKEISFEEEKKEEALGNQETHQRPNLFIKYEPPNNEIEVTICQIWEGALGISGIGIDDNFIELGGNSLIGIQIIARMTEVFPIDFNVDALLENPTIRQISDYVIEALISELTDEEIKSMASTT